MKKHLLLIAFTFFISTIFLFDSAFAAVSEGCEIFEIKAGCDLSGWLKLMFGISIGGGLAILLHYLAHHTNKKLEKNREQLTEHTLQLKENSIAIQKILDAQEYSRNRRRDYLLESSKSSFNAILLRLGIMNRIVSNKQNLDREDQYHKLELEESAIHTIVEKVRHTVSVAVDILDPMLATQIDNLFTHIEQLSPSKNKEKLEFSEYEEAKEKIMHLKERLEEFATTRQVLK